MAVFLGILVLHGMQPGPTMFVQHQREVYGLVLALTLAAVLASIIGLVFMRGLAAITKVPGGILAPTVIAVSLVGTFAIESRLGDVVLAGAFGLLGYLMLRFEYPRLPLVIALVLGETAERGFHQSMIIGRGDWSVFLDSPTSIVLVALIVLSLAWSPLRRLMSRRTTRNSGRAS
jgi:putative tricarboxylic transport membrane protein